MDEFRVGDHPYVGSSAEAEPEALSKAHPRTRGQSSSLANSKDVP